MQQRGLTRVLMQLCCIFLLLFAQQSALTHAVWHAGHAAAGHEQLAFPGPAHDSNSSDVAGLCAFDAAYGQVLGAAAATLHTGIAHPPVRGTTRCWHRSIVVSQFLAPLSRGPPALL